MKTTVKTKRARSAKRGLFAELSEGMAALAEARHGKRTLRSHASAPTSHGKGGVRMTKRKALLETVRKTVRGLRAAGLSR